RREFGGCAGNIAYNVKLLGGQAWPMATIGDDAQPYSDRLDRLQISQRFVRRIEGSFTAQAFITTDADNNQITAFHPGAMSDSHLNQIPNDGSIKLGIVAPDGRDGMLQHAEQFAEHGIPFVFDPGQGLPMFSGEELRWFVERATYVAVNDYEAKMLSDRTQLTLAELSCKVRALIVTHGAAGSQIHTDGKSLQIPVAPARDLVDPTGCGDAYRAGLLVGITQAMEWETIGKLAATMGSIKIECSGGQNHTADRESISDRFNDAFGYRPW
ncbi:MAG: carbohydrate kinase family protein, partial [Burkholderiaceae bacterium]